MAAIVTRSGRFSTNGSFSTERPVGFDLLLLIEGRRGKNRVGRISDDMDLLFLRITPLCGRFPSVEGSLCRTGNKCQASRENQGGGGAFSLADFSIFSPTPVTQPPAPPFGHLEKGKSLC